MEISINNQSKIYQGDCREKLDIFDAETFQAIIADPPYFLSNGGFTVHAGKRASVDKGKWDKSRGVLEDMIRVAQPLLPHVHRLARDADLGAQRQKGPALFRLQSYEERRMARRHDKEARLANAVSLVSRHA